MLICAKFGDFEMWKIFGIPGVSFQNIAYE